MIRKLRKDLSELKSMSQAEKSALSKQEKEKYLEMSFLERKLTYRYDFLAFIRELLDAENKGEDPQPLAPVHHRVCRFLRRTKNLRRNRLIMLPRNHLKTQIATMYYRIWVLLNDPNYAALIVSGTLELSKATAREIKTELKKNPKLYEFYPEVLPEEIFNPVKNKWSETQFTVKRTKTRKECSIEAIGIDATVAGKHFPEICFDDVVTSENSATPEGCDKVIKQFALLKSVVAPRIGVMTLVGTFYNDSDLYNYLLDLKDEINFEIFIEAIPLSREPIWPGMFTKEKLKEIEVTQGPYVFATQYLLDPVPRDKMELKAEWLLRYTTIPKDINGNDLQLNYFIIVDPITAKKLSSTSKDRGVVMVVAIEPKSQDIYIIEYELFSRATDSELFDSVFKFCNKYDTDVVGWECVAHQLNAKINLDIEGKKRGYTNFKAIELRPGNKDKDSRIRGMIPYFARGQINVRPTMQELIQEYLRFPFGKTRDILDVLSYIPVMIKKKRTLSKTLNAKLLKSNGSGVRNRQKPFYV